MKIIIGIDHGGFELKTRFVKLLKAEGCEIDDVASHNPESVDYADDAAALGRPLAEQTDHVGRLR